MGICIIQFINLGVLFVFVSMNVENFLNWFGILKGAYFEFSSAWYIEFGSMIVWTMVLEIGIPHGYPVFIMCCIMLMRWYDRRFTKDKTMSRKKRQ